MLLHVISFSTSCCSIPDFEIIVLTISYNAISTVKFDSKLCTISSLLASGNPIIQTSYCKQQKCKTQT